MININASLGTVLRCEGDHLSGDGPLSARERLRELCNQAKARGITQKDLAAKLGEDPMWITNRLTGHSQIHADDVPRLADALGIDVCDFYRGTDYDPEQAERMAAQWANRVAGLPQGEIAVLIDFLAFRQSRVAP